MSDYRELIAEEQGVDLTLNASFTVNTDASAEWCIDKIKKETQEADRLINLAEEMIKQYQDKISDIRHDLESKTSYFKGQLQQYFETVEHKATKTQETYKLLSGTLKLKHKPAKVVKDDLRLLEYLKDNNYSEYIETVEKAKWSELKATLKQVADKYVDENGVVVEGIELQEQASEFIVDIK